jgi:hypothetical protein
MRKVTDHKIEGIDNLLSIQVLDEPGAGGACHHYQITATKEAVLKGVTDAGLAEEINKVSLDHLILCDIRFQNSPLQEVGLNGITQEALIAICMDRLRSFQSGDFACESNVLALEHLKLALRYLQQRTRDRLARGVEGRSAQ